MAQLKIVSTIALVVLSLFGSVCFAQESKAEEPPPDGRVSGGTRTGECQLAEMVGSARSSFSSKLVALIPESKLPLQSAGALTLWFYVPFKSQQPINAEFRLKQKIGDQYKTIDQKTITIPQNSKLFSISIPQNQIKTGQDYQWWLSISCQPGDSSKDATVYARVQPIEVTLKLQKTLRAAKTIRQRIQIYQAAGLWYNALSATIEDLNCKDSQQAQALFSEFLQSIQFGEIAPIAKSSLFKVCQK